MRKFKNLKWTFAEWCLELPLLEQASERNDKMSKIKSLMWQLNLHLLKIYLMPNSRDLSHWEDEVDNWLIEIQRLKWGGKLFKQEDYYNWLCQDYIPEIETDIKRIKKKYADEYFITHNIEEFENMITCFYEKITYKLSMNQYKEIEPYITIFKI